MVCTREWDRTSGCGTPLPPETRPQWMSSIGAGLLLRSLSLVIGRPELGIDLDRPCAHKRSRCADDPVNQRGLTGGRSVVTVLQFTRVPLFCFCTREDLCLADFRKEKGPEKLFFFTKIPLQPCSFRIFALLAPFLLTVLPLRSSQLQI